MSWKKIIKEDLIISEILDKALPNFYNKIIDTHPDMKKTLDEAANNFRMAYYEGYPSISLEEEIITEIVMIVLDMLSDMEVDIESGNAELSLDEMLIQIPQYVVDNVIKKLHKKYQIGFMNKYVLGRLIRIFIFSIFIIVQTETQDKVRKSWEEVLKRNKGGDNFKREKNKGLHGWFERAGGKETKDGKRQKGWIDCSSCGKKGGPRPCGREDASKGRKRRCRPTCAACKTYKRRKGTP